jgi:polyhydroxyalkanoate synthesis regulator protein
LIDFSHQNDSIFTERHVQDIIAACFMTKKDTFRTHLGQKVGHEHRRMKKTYVERISLWVAENKSQKSKSLASFLAQKNDINEALNEGFSTYVIWKHQSAEENMKMSYRQFCRYVDKYIEQNERPKKQQAKDGKDNEPEKLKATFTFNPVPNEEDLY